MHNGKERKEKRKNENVRLFRKRKTEKKNKKINIAKKKLKKWKNKEMMKIKILNIFQIYSRLCAQRQSRDSLKGKSGKERMSQ